MRERRALRFVFEALFLGLLAAALVVADRSALEIAGIMLLGWLVVALYEWAATRERPHFGRGLPPRYYVPQVSLPPPRPLEQLPYAYPASELHDEEPTWIASPAMLADWPVASAPAPTTVEDTVVDDGLYAQIAAEEARVDPWLEPGAEARREVESEEAVRAEVEATSDAADDPEHPARAESELVSAAAAAVGVAEPEAVEEASPGGRGSRPVEPSAPVAEGARYSFDPFDQVDTARKWRHRPADQDGFAHFPAVRPTPTALPGRARES